MKRFLLLAMAVTVAMTACSKNDGDEGDGGEASLIGTWEIVKQSTYKMMCYTKILLMSLKKLFMK